MKKVFQLFLSIFFAILFIVSNSTHSLAFENNLDLKAESAILIDAKSGQILYGKSESQKMYPASTTKIMTLILALENSKLSEKVVVDDDTPFEVEGSHIALEPGEILTMEQLLNALMLESANDSALVLAKHISGSVENFSDLMNSKALEIGAANTHFVNPNGLPDKEHITTAHDLAMIAQYGMKNDSFRSFVSKTTDIIPPTNKKDEQRYLNNSNKMLYSEMSISVDGETVPIKYDGITGIKTGFTDDAQHCLIASASRNGIEYISVVLKTDKKNLYADTHKLLNYGFNNFKEEKVASEQDVFESISWKGLNLSGFTDRDLYCKIPLDQSTLDIKQSISIYPSLETPIKAGAPIGYITYSSEDTVLGSTNLFSETDIIEGKATTISISTYILSVLIFLIALLITRIIFVFIRRKRRYERRKKARRYKRQMEKKV